MEEIDFTKPWDYSDITFIVEGQKVFANKTVLSICSPVMKVMFEGEFKEKAMEEIELPGKSFDAFLALMKAVHPTGHFNNADSEKLLPLSHEYQMTNLTLKCESCLVCDTPNLSRLILADTFSLPKLRKVCFEHAKKTQLDDLRQDEMFHQLQDATMVELLDHHTKSLRNELDKQKQQLTGQVNSLQNELVKQKQQLTGQVNNLTAEIDRINKKNKELSVEINKLLTEGKNIDRRVAELKKDLQNVQSLAKGCTCGIIGTEVGLCPQSKRYWGAFSLLWGTHYLGETMDCNLCKAHILDKIKTISKSANR